MRLLIVLTSLLLSLGTSALADGRSHYLSCEDFDYLSNNLKEIEDMDQSIKVELLSEFIESTDPKCFS